MQYRINPKNGDRLSTLAFGCMRLGRDEKLAARLVARAIEGGVNYFDTAYIYPGNEALLGRAMPREHRHKVRIATKLPPFLVNSREDMERIFRTQLERLSTDTVEYYLIHMLTTPQSWDRLVQLGVLEWVDAKKRSGQIQQFGFSFHGGRDDFTAIVDAFDWDFCMIQYNYQDVNNQAGMHGLHHAAAKGIPVMVMEPLRGGRLAGRLPKEAMALWQEAPQQRSPAEWALRWVWNQPEVTTALSGMNTMAVLEENLRIAETALPGHLSQEELAVVERVRACLLAGAGIPCTGCGYCMPCPAGVDIPQCFASYNDRQLEGAIKAQYQYVTRTFGHNASRCTGCGACEKHCPQQIPVRQGLQTVKRSLEGGLYRPMRFAARKIMRLG